MLMKITLPKLEPHFLKPVSRLRYKYTDDIGAAEGMIFLCPACFWSNNGDKKRTHATTIWLLPRPRCWGFEGNGYDDLSLKAGRTPVHMIGGCRAHYSIQRGKVDFC
jgi:hypothetical protein